MWTPIARQMGVDWRKVEEFWQNRDLIQNADPIAPAEGSAGPFRPWEEGEK